MYFDSDSLASLHISILGIGNPLDDVSLVAIYFVCVCESKRKLHREVAIFHIYFHIVKLESSHLPFTNYPTVHLIRLFYTSISLGKRTSLTTDMVQINGS